MARTRSGKVTDESSDAESRSSQDSSKDSTNRRKTRRDKSSEEDDGIDMHVDNDVSESQEPFKKPFTPSKQPLYPHLPKDDLLLECASPRKSSCSSKLLAKIVLAILAFIVFVVAAAGFLFNANVTSCFQHPKDCYSDTELMVIDFVKKFNSKTMKDSSTQTETPWQVFKQRFRTDFVRKYDKAVPQDSFDIIKYGVKEIFEAIDKQQNGEELTKNVGPSVFLVLGRQGNKNVSCLVNDLESLIADSLREPRAMKITNADLSTTASITERFKSALESGERHVVTLDNLNQMNGETFLHLHPFTNHESARYRIAIIILVAYTEDVNSLRVTSRMRDMDKIASSFIHKTFIPYLKPDDIDPMIARLADSVTAVLDYPGTSSVCNN